MKTTYYLYFAYGANMNIENMRRRCPMAKPIGKARLKGYRLNFRNAVATVEPRKGDYVPGALWKITKACIKALDRFEGYPKLYNRISFKCGDMEEAQIYIMQPGYKESPPNDYYLNTIRVGYMDFGWGRRERNKLLKIAKKGGNIE